MKVEKRTGWDYPPRSHDVGSVIYGMEPRGHWLFVTVRAPVPWHRRLRLLRHRIRVIVE